jgi:hypothetical protein
MTADEILNRPARILSDASRERYFETGYLDVDGLVTDDWLEPLRDLTGEFVDRSRRIEGRDARFDLEPNHTADLPRLRRLNSPVELHELYWRFASEGPFADVAEDLLGPRFKFHHSKLNFKWSGGGEAVKWHQDIQFWPHTNYDVLTLGVYLEAVDGDMAPMGVVPRSHQGPLYELYDENDNWTGFIRDQDLPAVDLEAASYIVGQAGTVTVHNCRSIHGSAPNRSDRVRPLLLSTYSAADAFPITTLTLGASHSEEIIRGQPARWARFDSRPCPMPPDWSKQGGYKSIFAHQKREAS